jgi:hypothetical protein
MSRPKNTRSAPTLSPAFQASIASALVAMLLCIGFFFATRTDPRKEQAEATARLESIAPATADAEAEARHLREKNAAAALQHARTLAGRGSLSIATTPIGAQIYINDRDVGTTPFEGNDLPLGKYTVKVLRYGYATVDREFDLQAGARITETIPLIRDTGTLVVNTEPAGLPVFLTAESREDGMEPIQIAAPFERTLPTGNYQLEVQREGFARSIRTVNVSRGDMTRETVSLMPGKLEIDSVPTGAAVYRSGEHVGTTPYRLNDLSEEGNIYFEIKLDGYEVSSVYPSIRYGAVTKETVTLTKLAPEE